MATDTRIEKMKEVLSKRQPDLTAVFEDIYDPHNLMACLRSCDAVGVYEVHLVQSRVQSKKHQRIGHASSSSAKKWVEQRKYTDVASAFEVLRSQGKKIYTTHLDANAVSIHELDFTEPIAVVFGNENAGVTKEALDLADGNFIIPQVGMISSLNISVACAVTMYEAYRQRNLAKKYDKSQFDETTFDKIINDWIIYK